MTIYTPRGLKIRLSQDYSFALIGRLFPRVDPFTVLQTTEAFDHLVAFGSVLAGIAAFLMHATPQQVAITVFVTGLVVRAYHVTGLLPPVVGLLLPLARAYALLTGYGVFLLALIAVGWWGSGWRGLLGYAIGRFGAMAVGGAAEFAYSLWRARQGLLTITSSERSFFLAYARFARQLGVSGSIDVSDAEIASGKWKLALLQLRAQWPAVVAKFTDDV